MDYPGHISGFRSRVINAVIDAGRASRPVAGSGVRVAATAAGSVVSADPQAAAARPYPFMARLVRVVDSSSTSSDPTPALQLFIGAVSVVDGPGPTAEEAAFDAQGATLRDDDSGLAYAILPYADGAAAVWYACVSPTPSSARRWKWTLSQTPAQTGLSVAVAEVGQHGEVVQRVCGDLVVAEPPAAPEWIVTGIAYDPATHILSYTRRQARVLWHDPSASAETVPVATAVEESI